MSDTFIQVTLMDLAENLKTEHCVYQKDVIDAMFRQVHSDATKPFKNHDGIPNINYARFMTPFTMVSKIGRKVVWGTKRETTKSSFLHTYRQECCGTNSQSMFSKQNFLDWNTFAVFAR